MVHMDIRELGGLISDDRKSLEYLWMRMRERLCPFCGSTEMYYMGREEISVCVL